MRKQGLKLTGKVLAGLVLFSGITAVPTKAIDVQPAAVDVNVKNVKASVYEKEGHFYAKLVADKEVANVVARITTENKAQFLLKRDIIKAGEEVVVELDMKAQVPTRKLPHTGVKKESFNTVTKLSGHTFKITVSYEVATEEVKAQQKANDDLKKDQNAKAEQQKTAETKKTAEQTKPAETAKTAEQQKTAETKKTVEQTKPAETAKTVEQTKTGETTKTAETPKTSEAVAKPNTPVNAVPSNTPGESGLRSVMLNNPKTEVKTEVKTATNTEVKNDATKQTTQAVATTPVAASKEEQIRNAFIKKLNELRAKNGLSQLAPNAALNTATKARASEVVNTGGVTASVHGDGGSLEKAAATRAGYQATGNLLYNVVQVVDSGNPEQVAEQLLKELFTELHNVTPAHKYGHRNTLLEGTSTEVGVGVAISGGYATLVQHQNNFGTYNGSTPKQGIFLDGNSYI